MLKLGSAKLQAKTPRNKAQNKVSNLPNFSNFASDIFPNNFNIICFKRKSNFMALSFGALGGNSKIMQLKFALFVLSNSTKR